MKKYEQPAIELIKFSLMEVLAASSQDQTPGTFDGGTQEGNFDDLFGAL